MVQDTKNRRTYWNDALPPDVRAVVDTCLDRIGVQDWQQRRDTIETTVAAAAKSATSLQTGIANPEHMTGTIVAAIIERLETPAIVEIEQAELFAMSACPDHQIAACNWLIEAATGTFHLPDAARVPIGMRLH